MNDCLDEQLVADYLSGDEKSLEVLIKSYLRPIYSFVYRYIGNVQEAEDITQEVFVKVWRNLKKFNPDKKFKTWIFSIAKNASIDFLRKKKTILFSEMEPFVDPRPLQNEFLLTSIIDKLSPKYRMVLFLRYNDHFTFREIAETLGESIDTIKTRHRRGMAILRKLLAEK